MTRVHFHHREGAGGGVGQSGVGESKRDGVAVRKVSIFMVCFIKVTIIQWYIVLNSQKYEQIFTARHTHNGNISLQKQVTYR